MKEAKLHHTWHGYRPEGKKATMPYDHVMGERYMSKSLKGNFRSWFRICLEEDGLRRITPELISFVQRGYLHFAGEISAFIEMLSRRYNFRFPPRNIYNIVSHIFSAERVFKRLQELPRTHNRSDRVLFSDISHEEVSNYQRDHPPVGYQPREYRNTPVWRRPPQEVPPNILPPDHPQIPIRRRLLIWEPPPRNSQVACRQPPVTGESPEQPPRRILARSPNNVNKIVVGTIGALKRADEEHRNKSSSEVKISSIGEDLMTVYKKLSVRNRDYLDRKNLGYYKLSLVTKQAEVNALDYLWFDSESMPIIFGWYLPPTCFATLLFVSKKIRKQCLQIMTNPRVLNFLLNLTSWGHPVIFEDGYVTLESAKILAVTVKESSFPLSTFLLPFYVKRFVSSPDTLKTVIIKRTLIRGGHVVDLDDSDLETWDDGTGYGPNNSDNFDSDDDDVQETTETVTDHRSYIVAMKMANNYGEFCDGLLPLRKERTCYCSLRSTHNKDFHNKYPGIFNHMDTCQQNTRRMVDIQAFLDHVKHDIFPTYHCMEYIEDVYDIEVFVEEVFSSVIQYNYDEKKVGHLVGFIYHQLWVREAVTALNIFNATASNPSVVDGITKDFRLKLIEITRYFPMKLDPYDRMYWHEPVSDFRKLLDVTRMIAMSKK